jgi:hypothetical protein
MELKQATDDPNFISNIITGDETWVYGYDPEQQSSQPVTKFTVVNKSASSLQQYQADVDHVSPDIQRIVHNEFVPPGQNINTVGF